MAGLGFSFGLSLGVGMATVGGGGLGIGFGGGSMSSSLALSPTLPGNISAVILPSPATSTPSSRISGSFCNTVASPNTAAAAGASVTDTLPDSLFAAAEDFALRTLRLSSFPGFLLR